MKPEQSQFQSFEPQSEVSSLPRQRRPEQSSFSPEAFEPQRQSPPTGGRQRLEVTDIRVRPQQPQGFQDEPLDIDAFRQVANRFRQRGSQGQN